MLTLVLGRQGSGKSEYLYKKAVRAAANGITHQVFLVPETHSHTAERLLCTHGGDNISLYCEVLTFRRLKNRVFAEYGGLADRVLDDGGRILLMQNAYENVKYSLKYYIGTPGPELLEGFIKIIDEFKSCCIDNDTILELMSELDLVLASKLSDLLLIKSAYDSLCDEYHDPGDDMTRLADALHASRWFDGRRVYIDGFSGFTPQEYLVLENLESAEVTAAFTCDGYLESQNSEVFGKSIFSAAKLVKIIGGGHADTVRLNPPTRYPDLAHLEHALFDYSAPPYSDVPEHIELHAASGAFAECEQATARIMQLMRGGIRCRDITVVSGNFDRYRLALESSLERFSIPYFITEKTDLRTKSVTALVMHAVSIAAGGFRHDEIFAYLKTGLTGIPRGDIDILENYCLMWRIRPSQWTKDEPWSMNPDGFGAEFTDENTLLLERINETRERAGRPLIKLGAVLREDCDTIKKLKAIYKFMEDIELPASISRRENELLAAGQPVQADEYRQLWDILCRCLDSFADIAGKRQLDARSFEKLFTLVLSRYDIGSIPPSADRVACGELSRLRALSARAVIIIGAGDGALPPSPESSGLLSDNDRDILDSYDIELSFTPDSRANEGMLDVYNNFSKARELLYISYPRADDSGNALRPAYIIRRMETLFPNMNVMEGTGDEYLLESPRTALDYAALHGSAAQDIHNILKYLPGWNETFNIPASDSLLPEDSIAENSVDKLYGRELQLSATRFDSFNSCRFAYFSRYGLGLKPRREADFDAPQRGLFIHFVLEGVVRSVSENGGFAACTREKVRDFAREYVADYIRRDIPDFNAKTARFRYLFNRIRASLDIIIDNLYDEFSKSSFRPLDFELSFASDMPSVRFDPEDGSASLHGVCDRIDGWVRDGVLYIRVVDYKSGAKAFSYGEIMNGLGMQLPVYLFALRREAELYLARHPEIDADIIVPAGLLYTPARTEPYSASHDMPDEDLKQKLDSALVRSGIILSDSEVISAMEPDITSEGRFIPVKLLKNGSPSPSSGVADAEQFELLEQHVGRILRLTARLISDGRIDARPAVTRGVPACTYCDYRTVCFLNCERNADRVKYIPSMSSDGFYSILKEGGSDER